MSDVERFLLVTGLLLVSLGFLFEVFWFGLWPLAFLAAFCSLSALVAAIVD